MAFIGLVVVAGVYALAGILIGTQIALFFSLFLVILGAIMVFLGFWGSDYAFSTSLGESNQETQKGKFKGEKGKVFVPFMKNYTPSEWWNLNWFITGLGALLLALGSFMLGLSI